MGQQSIDREKETEKKGKAGMLAEFLVEVLLFTLLGWLWLYIWFGTDLLQNYY